MSNETSSRGPGRPAKVISYPDGIFTVESLFGANASAACKLTVRKNVKRDAKAGILVVLKSVEKTGKAGRPSVRYSTKASYDARCAANAAARAATGAAKAAVTPTEVTA